MKYAACEKCARSVGKVNIVGNILMILIKGYMGVVGGSKGLIADAVHSCADLLATIVMIIGLHISGQEKDEAYPYGYGKAEYIVAVVIYLFLFVIGTYILFDGARAILEGRRVTPCLSAAWGAIFSIAINELMFRQSVCAGAQINSPSITAKAWETRSDVLSSIAVLIGILGAKMGFHFMDPLAAIIVGVIILRVCVEQVRGAITNLMDGAPEAGSQTKATKTMTLMDRPTASMRTTMAMATRTSSTALRGALRFSTVHWKFATRQTTTATGRLMRDVPVHWTAMMETLALWTFAPMKNVGISLTWRTRSMSVATPTQSAMTTCLSIAWSLHALTTSANICGLALAIMTRTGSVTTTMIAVAKKPCSGSAFFCRQQPRTPASARGLKIVALRTAIVMMETHALMTIAV